MSAREDMMALASRISDGTAGGWCAEVRANLDAYRDEILREAAEQIREAAENGAQRVRETYNASYYRGWLFGRMRAADLIDPDVQS